MTALVLVVVLGVVLLACRVLVDRFGVAPPLLQLSCGVLLGLVPTLRDVHIPPQVALLVLLPVLVYWKSLSMGLRSMLANLRVIVVLATGLVLATATVNALVAHALGLTWGPAWVVGAALSPTNATAVEVLAKALPRRMLTTLRAESLVSDGTALVVYGVAVSATVGGAMPGAAQVGGQVLLSYAGGVAAGLFVAVLSNVVRRRLADPVAGNVNTLIAPFAAVLVAHTLHGSAVLAVVTCGLVALRLAPRFGHPEGRRQRDDFWTLGSYLLNGTLFVFVGSEAVTAARALSGAEIARGLELTLALAAATVAVRFAWLFASPYALRVLDRRYRRDRQRLGARARVVYAVAGSRGVVSLAVMLALPATTSSGAPFPDRGVLVFVSAGVVVLTLAQALVLPAVVRWAHLPPDDTDAEERRVARTAMVSGVLESLDRLAEDLGTPSAVVDSLRQDYTEELRGLEASHGAPAAAELRQRAALRVAVLHRERDVLLGLRDEGRVDDDIVAEIESRLDLEEVGDR